MENLKSNKIEKVGVVATSNISMGGGYPKVIRDLINALTILGKKVYLATPFEVDFDKIEKFYGAIKVEKVFNLSKFKIVFCKEVSITRRLIKKEFQKMVQEVDMIIDMDGGVLHNYLPANFNNKRYVIWRGSPACSDLEKFNDLPKSFERKVKDLLQKIFNLKRNLPSKKHKIYALDNYTENELKKYWGLKSEKHHLYPEVAIENFFYDKKRKKNLILISGRIASNKRLDDSIKIFCFGTKKFPDYELVIIGGTVHDSKHYINYLKKLAERLGISEKVRVIPNPSYEKLREVLLDAKVLLDAQQGESTTITAIEALASGAIVLASTRDCGTWWEMLESGKWGFGFDNVEEGGRKLENILENLEKGNLNPEKFMKRTKFYSHENFVKRIKKILDVAE